MRLHTIWLIGLALSLAFPLAAQTPLQDTIPETVVTATGTSHLLKDVPVQTEVITRRMLQNYAGRSLEDILGGLTASFAFNEDDMGSHMQLGGLGNSYILILIDGKRIHGDVGGGMGYDPIGESEIAASGLRYLALGHVHACSGLRQSGDTYWAYPGCLMGRGFDETGDKGYLTVTLDGDDCRAEFHPLPGRKYEICSVDVTGAESLLSAVEAALPEDASRHVYRVLLRGQWPEKPRPEALAEALADRCFQIEVRDETQLMTDVWLGAGEDTLRGCFLRVLKKKYDAAPEEAKAGITLAARYGLAALDYREDL